MLRNFTFVLMCFLLFAANSACTTAESPTANANSVNAVNLDPANLPPGFSTSPIPLSANSTPGIPGASNVNAVPIGNVPGIPDTNKMGKTPQPKNTPPIPGIPDEETLKRQMNTPLKDVNVVNNPPKNQSTANDRPAEKSRGNTRQP